MPGQKDVGSLGTEEKFYEWETINRKMTDKILEQLQMRHSEEKARILQRFFKTGPGQYGEGDVFLGITVPALRKMAAQYQGIALESVLGLIRHPYHEARLLALLLVIQSFQKSDPTVKQTIFDAYLAHTRFINNWDLVDLSAPHIVGAYLADGNRDILNKLAISKQLWERRIAIVATCHFIREGEFQSTLDISDLLLHDREDLIHKAVGWMLREVGKRDQALLEGWLKSRYQQMPRTMLRYAIEKFTPQKRQGYLRGLF